MCMCMCMRGSHGLYHAPLHGDGQFPRPRHGLDDDIGLGDAAGSELLDGAGQQRLDDAGIPPRVHDADAQPAAVMLLRSRALDGGGHDYYYYRRRIMTT